jgi:hypothetical protein
VIAEDRTIRAVSPASVEVLQFLASHYRTSSAGAVALAVLVSTTNEALDRPGLGRSGRSLLHGRRWPWLATNCELVHIEAFGAFVNVARAAARADRGTHRAQSERRPQAAMMIGENADQFGSSNNWSMRSTSSSESMPTPTSRVRRWASDNWNQRAPGDPPSITHTRPSFPTAVRPSARRRAGTCRPNV